MAENDVNPHSQNLDIIPNRSPAAKCQHVWLHCALDTQNIYSKRRSEGRKKSKDPRGNTHDAPYVMNAHSPQRDPRTR